MAVRIEREVKQRAVQSVRRFLDRELEIDLGDLQAELLLDHILKRIAPLIYNQAVADTQSWLQEKLMDLDGEVFEIDPPSES